MTSLGSPFSMRPSESVRPSFRSRPRVGQHTCTPSACARSMILVRKVRLRWFHQWPSQEPSEDGGTDSIYKAYVLGLCNRKGHIWPRGKAWKMVAISTADTWIRQQCWQTPRRILTWRGVHIYIYMLYIYIYVIYIYIYICYIYIYVIYIYIGYIYICYNYHLLLYGREMARGIRPTILCRHFKGCDGISWNMWY